MAERKDRKLTLATDQRIRSDSPVEGARPRYRSIWQRLRLERLVEFGLSLCAGISILTTAGIIAVLVFQATQFFVEVSIIDFI